MNYKINEAINIYYRSIGAESSISDLTLIVTNNSGVDVTTITMSSVVGNPGLYFASFTPNSYGRWWIRISSISHSENVYAESYFVGANRIISDDNRIVTVTTDAIKERLDVDVRPIKYRLQMEHTTTDIDFIDDTWHTIFDISAEGKPNYLWTEFYNGNYEIRITMDGEIVWQLDDNNMGRYDLSDGNQTRYQPGVLYRRSTDVISWHFSPSLTFDTQFKYEVRRESGIGHGFDRAFLQWEKKY